MNITNKKFLVIYIMFITTAISLISTVEANAETIDYYIPDESLQRCLEMNNFYDSDDIEDYTLEEFKEEAEGVTRLSCFKMTSTSGSIYDFEGLQYFTNLETLSVRNAYLEELPQEITGLENLTSLTLEYSTSVFDFHAPLTDLTGLSELQNLEALSINNYSIETIDEINQLTKLTELDLSENKIDNIDGINNLNSLVTLNLSDNELKSTEAIEQLPNLETLELSYNYLEDISGIENLTNLKLLDIYYNEVDDVDGIENLTKLEYLDLRSNRIEEFPDVSQMSNLDELLLRGNQITKIEHVENLENLRILNLSGNDIEIVENLDGLSSLYDLDLSQNEIVNVNGLVDEIPSSVTSLDLADQYVYTHDNRGEKSEFDEVFQKTNCTDESCTLDFNNFLMDSDEYTAIIESGSKFEESTSFGQRISYKYELSTVSDYQGEELPYNNNYSLNVEISTYDFRTQDLINYVDNAITDEEDLVSESVTRSMTAAASYFSDDDIFVSSWGGYDINDPQPGEYEITLTSDIYDYDMQSTFTYTLLARPILYTNDSIVEIDEAPTSDEEIILNLDTQLLTSTNEVISTEEVMQMDDVIVETNDYDVESPEIGDFDIEISYTDEYGIMVDSTSMLKVIDEEDVETEEIDEVEEVDEVEEIDEVEESETVETEVIETEEIEIEDSEADDSENVISDTGIKYSIALISMLLVSILVLLKVRIK